MTREQFEQSALWQRIVAIVEKRQYSEQQTCLSSDELVEIKRAQGYNEACDWFLNEMLDGLDEEEDLTEIKHDANS